MQFLLSLFCWQGFDNRMRFGAIQLASLVIILISIQSSIVFALITTVLGASISTFTAKRRLSDIEVLKQPWMLWLAPLTYIAFIAIAMISHGAAYALLLLP